MRLSASLLVPVGLGTGGDRLLARASCPAGPKSGPSPVDRARPGSKHHLIVDGQGIPLAVSLTGGNRNDVTQLLPARQDPTRRAATVRALDGDAPGSALWSHTFKKDPGNIQNGAGVWRLAMAEGRLIASAENDEKIGAAENVGSWARELAESAR